MLLTDRIRKAVAEYIFEQGINVTDFYRALDDQIEASFHYETFRKFQTDRRAVNGSTLNQIDKFLKRNYEEYQL